jgi:ABC-type antimicrobial peptide transport system permease subunit
LAVKPGLQLAAVGAVAGLVAAVAATRLMKALLFGVSATDPLTYVAVTGVLLLIALVACLIPAWRATQVSPIRALRAD